MPFLPMDDRPDSKPRFSRLAVSRQVVRSAIKVSVVVGTILVFINHGGAIVQMSLNSDNLVQILLTYLVPYCVSTYSSVRAIQAHSGINN